MQKNYTIAVAGTGKVSVSPEPLTMTSVLLISDAPEPITNGINDSPPAPANGLLDIVLE